MWDLYGIADSCRRELVEKGIRSLPRTNGHDRTEAFGRGHTHLPHPLDRW
jgi:hypothetical protein